MGRIFSFSSAWERHDRQIRREGGVNRGGADRLAMEAQEVRAGEDGADPERVVRSRLRYRDVSIGIDSDQAHHRGEEVNIISDAPEIVGGKPTGDILVQYVARGSDDRPRTYEQRWRKTGEGQHVSERPRRIFT